MQTPEFYGHNTQRKPRKEDREIKVTSNGLQWREREREREREKRETDRHENLKER